MNKTVLITGASKGIGQSLAQQFHANGYTVIGTGRKIANGPAIGTSIEMYPLDLGSEESIKAFIEALAGRKIDILINNAGIGPDMEMIIPEGESMRASFETNVFGTVFFTEHILGHLHSQPVIINVSSKMGSIGLCEGFDSVAYRMSKTALNMYTRILANRLGDKARVATIHPGWVRTALAAENINAPLSPEESAAAIYAFATSDFKTGIFWNAVERKEIPW